MDLRRLRAGEWIVGLGGAALLASLFLPWYIEAESAERHSISGFEAFTVLDVLFALVALAALALPVVTATQRVPAVPLAMDALVALAGIIATILVLVRVLNLPDVATGREWALWLALAGAAAIVIGGFVSMRDERLSKPGRSTDLSGRPAPPDPLPEPIPAPRE